MEERTIDLNGKTFKVREIKYREISNFSNANPEEVSRKLMVLATGITNEEYDELSMKDGLKLMGVVNELNGLTENFQQKQTEQ